MMGPIIQSGRPTAIKPYFILTIVNATAFYLDIVNDNFALLAINAFFNGHATGTWIILSFGASAEILGKDVVVEGYSITRMFF